jgi:hypothetical protein
MKVIQHLRGARRCHLNPKASHRFPPEKGQRYFPRELAATATWLKAREINSLKSP